MRRINSDAWNPFGRESVFLRMSLYLPPLLLPLSKWEMEGMRRRRCGRKPIFDRILQIFQLSIDSNLSKLGSLTSIKATSQNLSEQIKNLLDHKKTRYLVSRGINVALRNLHLKFCIFSAHQTCQLANLHQSTMQYGDATLYKYTKTQAHNHKCTNIQLEASHSLS